MKGSQEKKKRNFSCYSIKKGGAKEYIYIALYISVKKTRFFNKVINNTPKNLIQMNKESRKNYPQD